MDTRSKQQSTEVDGTVNIIDNTEGTERITVNITGAEENPSSGEPIRRRRGRPKGSRNNPIKFEKTTQEEATVNKEKVTVKSSSKTTKKKQAKEDAEIMATFIIATLEGLGSTVTHKDCSFNPFEYGLVQPNLVSYLENANPKSIKKLNGILTPIMLGAGLLLWGKRTIVDQLPKPAPINKVNTVPINEALNQKVQPIKQNPKPVQEQIRVVDRDERLAPDIATPPPDVSTILGGF